MRHLMWITLGFGAACAFGAWVAAGVWNLVLGILFALLLAAALWLRLGGSDNAVTRFLKSSAAKYLFLILLGLSLGLLWYWGYDTIWLRPARNADGQTREITFLVTEDPKVRSYRAQAQGLLDLDGREFKAIVYLKDTENLPEPGQLLTLRARLRLTADGGSQDPTYHRTNGIFLLAYEDSGLTITQGELGWRRIPLALGRWVRGALISVLPEDTVGFAQALLLGDTSALTYTQRNSFSLVGISHIVAVSGMHMSILFAVVLFLTRRKRWLSALVGVPVLSLFSAMTGFSPSSLRAAVMLSLTMIAQLVDSDYDSPTALSFAVLVLLVVNPISAASIGLLMSVGAVAGILLFTKLLQAMLQGLWSPDNPILSAVWRWVCGGLAITMGASVFTIPIAAAAFGVVSLISPLANLMTVWAVSFIFIGLLLVCALTLLWTPLAVGLGWLVSWPIRYILGTARVLSRFPLAAVFPGENPYMLAWLILTAVLLLILLLFGFEGKLSFALCVAVGFALCLTFSWLEPLTDHFRVTVVDVGQGQCILLQSEGHTFAVDCGSMTSDAAGESAARILQSMGVFRLDGVILTHLDTDHVSGVTHLISRIPADTIFLPEGPEPPEWDAPLTIVGRDLKLEAGEMELCIFAPLSHTTANDSGLSVLFRWGKYDTLITGDMGQELEQQLLRTHELPDIEILIGGHHGSKTSTGQPLLDALQPEVVVFSVGVNSYGHPSYEVLNRAAEAGCEIYRTDRNGTVILRG